MSDHVVVRRAVASDAEKIASFNLGLALETEDLKLNEETVRRGVAGLIANPQYGLYVVAEHAGKVVGSLMITYEWTDWRNGLYWWIQSVYVEPHSRRLGVFRSLQSFIKAMALKEPNVRGIRLYVEKENEKAHRAYEGIGMKQAHYDVFEEIFSPR